MWHFNVSELFRKNLQNNTSRSMTEIFTQNYVTNFKNTSNIDITIELKF